MIMRNLVRDDSQSQRGTWGSVICPLTSEMHLVFYLFSNRNIKLENHWM